jgi:hypothetical protein
MAVNMSKASKTLFVFSGYVGIVALILMVVPNTLLELLGYPPTREVWIRIVGMCFGGLAFYYALGALENLRRFIQLTVLARSLTIVFFSLLYFLGLSRPVLIVFGVIDLLGAIWTELALRRETISG